MADPCRHVNLRSVNVRPARGQPAFDGWVCEDCGAALLREDAGLLFFGGDDGGGG